jgi:hypothetical protein
VGSCYELLVPSRRNLAALVALPAAFAALTGPRALAASPPPSDRPNIILIVLDTFRADRIGARRDGKSLTPFLDEWAKRGLVFRKALSPADHTLQSHFAMLTGYPADAYGTPVDVPALSVVADMNAVGYDTIGLAANPSVDPATMSCVAPFQTFVSSPYVTATPVTEEIFERIQRYRLSPHVLDGTDMCLGKLLSSAQAMNERLRSVLESCEPRRGGRPVFLFMNFFDTHDVYMPPEGFGPSSERLWAAWPVNGDIRRFPVQGNNPRHLRQVAPYMYADNYTPGELRFLTELYDGDVRYLDAQLRETFQLLERHGLLHNSVVVLTADHGEALGEGGFLAHGLGGFLEKPFEVPLVIRGYGLSMKPTDPVSTLTHTDRIADSLRTWARTDEGRELPANTFRRAFNLDPLARIEFMPTLHRKAVPLASGNPGPAASATPDEAPAGATAQTKEAKEAKERNAEAIRRLRSLGYLN